MLLLKKLGLNSQFGTFDLFNIELIFIYFNKFYSL